jgi:serine phosphatase RsbU (regulator of sigma subunit)
MKRKRNSAKTASGSSFPEKIEGKVHMVAGAMPDLPYTLIHDRLEVGEALFLHTDGISEARSTNRRTNKVA